MPQATTGWAYLCLTRKFAWNQHLQFSSRACNKRLTEIITQRFQIKIRCNPNTGSKRYCQHRTFVREAKTKDKAKTKKPHSCLYMKTKESRARQTLLLHILEQSQAPSACPVWTGPGQLSSLSPQNGLKKIFSVLLIFWLLALACLMTSAGTWKKHLPN